MSSTGPSEGSKTAEGGGDEDVDAGSGKKLIWMYGGLSSHVNREEYLTGRKVDKTFDLIREEESGTAKSDFDVDNISIPRAVASSSSSAAGLPLQSSSAVDLEAKRKEDPLSLIAERELQRRKEILLNPVRIKRLQHLIRQTLSSSSSSSESEPESNSWSKHRSKHKDRKDKKRERKDHRQSHKKSIDRRVKDRHWDRSKDRSKDRDRSPVRSRDRNRDRDRSQSYRRSPNHRRSESHDHRDRKIPKKIICPRRQSQAERR